MYLILDFSEYDRGVKIIKYPDYGYLKWSIIFFSLCLFLASLSFTTVVYSAAAIPPKRGRVSTSQGGTSEPSIPPSSLPAVPVAVNPSVSSSAYPAASTLSLPQNPYELSLPNITPLEQNPANDLQRVVNNLKNSSRIWPEITKRSLKEMVVYYFISEYNDKGEKIKKSPGFYVDLIDGMASQSPEMLAQPFEQILRVVAVIEYDFDNGQDKDLMAKQILGEEGAARNKIRLGIQ